jgi:hypothetical protein
MHITKKIKTSHNSNCILQETPDEIILEIGSFLTIFDIIKLSLTCKRMNTIYAFGNRNFSESEVREMWNIESDTGILNIKTEILLNRDFLNIIFFSEVTRFLNHMFDTRMSINYANYNGRSISIEMRNFRFHRLEPQADAIEVKDIERGECLINYGDGQSLRKWYNLQTRRLRENMHDVSNIINIGNFLVESCASKTKPDIVPLAKDVINNKDCCYIANFVEKIPGIEMAILNIKDNIYFASDLIQMKARSYKLKYLI